jgi:hypothetical protein
MTLIVRTIVALTLSGLAAFSAHASEVINLPGTSGMGVQLALGAGDYIVQFVNPTTNAEALYTAFDRWGNNPTVPPVSGCDAQGFNCTTGWSDSFSIWYGGNQYHYGDAVSPFESADEAFAQTITRPLFEEINGGDCNCGPYFQTTYPIQLNLASDATVQFVIESLDYAQDTGGVSLLLTQVSSVPEPNTAVMLLTGLLAMAATFAWRRVGTAKRHA